MRAWQDTDERGAHGPGQPEGGVKQWQEGRQPVFGVGRPDGRCELGAAHREHVSVPGLAPSEVVDRQQAPIAGHAPHLREEGAPVRAVPDAGQHQGGRDEVEGSVGERDLEALDSRDGCPGKGASRGIGPFPDDSFDLVSASLVLSTIRDRSGRAALLAEMSRVTRAGGLLAIYDFRVRKPWNRNVVAMSGSELAAALGPPNSEFRLGPFLPLLDPALKLPGGLRGPTIGLLPRTHRLWVWKV